MRSCFLFMLSCLACIGQPFNPTVASWGGAPASGGGLVSGAYAIWDADAITTGNGSVVTNWIDSANGLVATRLTALPYLTLTNNVLNGHSIIHSLGNDCMVCTNPANAAQPIIIYVVANHRVVSSPARYFTGATNTQYMQFGFQDDITGRLYAGSLASGGNIPTNTWMIFSCIFNGTQSEYSTNGVRAFGGDAGSGAQQGINLFGANNLVATSPNADIAYVVFYTNSITGNETNSQNITFLKNRFGL